VGKSERSPPSSGHEIGSRNVYRDLGFGNADEMLAKAQLVSEVSESISSSGLAFREAADHAGCTPRELRHLLQGRFRQISMTTLEAILARLESTNRAQE
jgi:predicted XRE-type DNA-binding protein